MKGAFGGLLLPAALSDLLGLQLWNVLLGVRMGVLPVSHLK